MKIQTKEIGALCAALLTAAVSSQAAVIDQWDFDNGDLSATLGPDLEYFDPDIQANTAFGTTTSFGIPDINGTAAKVMQFPALVPFGGYKMFSNAAANGGGGYINQYTFIVDQLYPAASDGKFRSFWQTSAENANDQDFAINTSNGIGISGQYHGSILPNVWHRVAFAVDLSAPQPIVSKFIDGVKVADQVLGEGRDGRWSLYSVADAFPSALLFADNDGDNQLGYVNSFQFRDYKMSDAEIQALGGATAAGIPTNVLPAVPFVKRLTPLAGEGAAAASIAIGADVEDGQKALDPASVHLFLDNAEVTTTKTKVGTLTEIRYTPSQLLASGSSHTVRLVYANSGTPTTLTTNDWSFRVGTYKTVDARFALAAGAGTTRGFLIKTALTTSGAGLPNTLARAEAQINGTLRDANGDLFPNDAERGPNADGSYNWDGVINFDQDQKNLGNFPGGDLFPGIIDTGANDFSDETIAYLELPAGFYRFGVNSDDGFDFRLGSNPRSAIDSVSVGSFEGGRGAADTLFDFVIPVAGVYPMRLLHEEGTGDANLELFSVDPNTGEKTLVNDAASVKAIKAYRAATGAATGPYVRETTPPPSATDVRTTTSIGAVLVAGANPISEGTIQLFLNNTQVTGPTITTANGATTVSYQPAAAFSNKSTNTVKIVFGDGTTTVTNSWTFVTAGPSQKPGITGQWDFDGGDLTATIGAPLEYLDGPGGTTKAGTAYGTTAALGLPPVGGRVANVMRIPPAATKSIGYVMSHGAVPNGDGTKVNRYTLIMDMYFPRANNEEWFSFVQIDSPANGNDGDLFAAWRTDADGNEVAGIGIGGDYTPDDGVTVIHKGTWHRIAFAVDMTSDNEFSQGVISKFIDGVKFKDQLRGQVFDGRHALLSTAILFGDEDGESQEAFVNSVQIRNYKMTDAEIAALGAPTADGVPTVSGQWDFENGDLKATLGSDLGLRGDTTPTFSAVTIGGTEAKIMGFPATTQAQGFAMWHGGQPNGAGTNVNQYTLVMDLMYPTASDKKWRSLFQVNTNNTDDGDMFVNTSNGIGISSQYHGNITPDVWHRVAFAFDLTQSTVGKYVDGALVNLQTLSSGVDGRWSLQSGALLFADNDGETAAGFVNSIQFRPVRLSDAQIATLGSATAGGIPLSILPTVVAELRIDSITRAGNNITINWAGAPNLRLQTKTALTDATWTDVPNTAGASTATIPMNGTGFFRLFGP